MFCVTIFATKQNTNSSMFFLKEDLVVVCNLQSIAQTVFFIIQDCKLLSNFKNLNSKSTIMVCSNCYKNTLHFVILICPLLHGPSFFVELLLLFDLVSDNILHQQDAKILIEMTLQIKYIAFDCSCIIIYDCKFL